jgi:hypothetical protein
MAAFEVTIGETSPLHSLPPRVGQFSMSGEATAVYCLVFSGSGQRLLLRTVARVIGNGYVTGERSGLERSEGNLDLATGSNSYRATTYARCDFLGRFNWYEREVAAGSDGGDIQGGVAGVGKNNLLHRTYLAHDDLAPLERRR